MKNEEAGIAKGNVVKCLSGRARNGGKKCRIDKVRLEGYKATRRGRETQLVSFEMYLDRAVYAVIVLNDRVLSS